MSNEFISDEDVQHLVMGFELISQENEALRRYIGELEERLSFEKTLKAVKIGGFNYACIDCNEYFDMPGIGTTCPFCKSIKIEMINSSIKDKNFLKIFLEKMHPGTKIKIIEQDNND